MLVKALLLAATPLALQLLPRVVPPEQVLHHAAYEQALARHLLAGQAVAFAPAQGPVANYDNRLLQRHYIAGLKATPDVVAIGSSRLFELRASRFPGQRFANNSVGLPVVEDLMALYGMYRARGMAPKTVVLGLEPWMLNANHGLTRWRDFIPEDYARIADALGLPAPQEPWHRLPEPYRGLLAAKTDGAIAAWVRRTFVAEVQPRYKFYVAPQPLAERNRVVFPDGSLAYDAQMRAKKPADVRFSAIYHFTHPKTVDELKDFTALDKPAARKFEAFLALLQADGVEPVFFLVPFHPGAYPLQLKDPRYQMVAQAEKYFRWIARPRGIEVIGSYDPATQPVDDGDYYDGLHARESAIVKILERHRAQARTR